ncbi:MAG: hypothetical protein C4575_09415 [Desulforudis sp.]|nr:MAG: hypothetical protein C4575_09415 [Desulforudis sp.]
MNPADARLIDDIQAIREQNNKHWMDLVRLAFREKPEEARAILKKIKDCDRQINERTEKLSEGRP